MRRLRSIIYSLCCGLAAALFLCACTADGFPIDSPVPTTDSIPADSLGSFELTFTGTAPATRATTTHITQEEALNFLVTIYKGSDIVRSATRLGDLNATLSAGYGYRIMAENCTELDAITVNDGWGQKRFAGFSASFAIKAGKTTAVNVGCSVANAAVEVVFDESVAEYFTEDYYITLQDGNRTIVFNSETAGSKKDGVVTTGRTAYFNLDDDGSHNITYTITAIGPKTLIKEGSLDLKQAKVSNITLDYERSNFTFGITLDEEEMYVTEVVNISEHDVKVEDGTTEFNATHEAFTADDTPIETRAILGNDGNIVNWEASDAIAVYDFSSNKRRFTATEANGNRAKFTGKVTPKSQYYAAIYPYDLAEQPASSAAALSATLPTTQYAVAGNIASALNISVGKGERHLDGSPDQITFFNTTELLSFTIPAYAEDKISSITLTATTPIAGKLNINYSGDTPDVSIGSTESKTMTILPPKRISKFEAGTYYIAAAPVQISGFTFTYTCDGRNYTQTSSSTFGGKAGHIYELGCIDLINTPSVSATHVYADGLLQGTQVLLTGAPIEGHSWSAVIKNASGATVRTIAAGTGDHVSAETDATWPYLPMGDYTVTYSFVDSNGKNRTASTTFSVPKPTLTLTVDGYSAHTKYEAGDITSANACNRLTVYNPSARLSVSNALLTNSNYSHSYSRTFSHNNQTATTSEASNNPTWSNYTNVPVSGDLYTLSVTASFAGETAKGSKTFRITGLPYSLNFSSHSEWSSSGTISWGNSQVQFGKNTLGTQSITTSSAVNIPQDTKYCAEYSLNIHTATVGSTFTISVGSQEVLSVSEGGKVGNISGSDHRHAATTSTFTANGNLTVITCHNSYGSGQTCSYLYGLTVKYGN